MVADAPAHHAQIAPDVGVAHRRSRIIWKHARHRREVADVAVDDAKQCGNRGLVGGDAVEVAHALCGLPLLKVR